MYAVRVIRQPIIYGLITRAGGSGGTPYYTEGLSFFLNSVLEETSLSATDSAPNDIRNAASLTATMYLEGDGVTCEFDYNLHND